MWLCILSGRRFKDTCENTQWRKVKQMQSMRLCILSGKQFEDTFDNAKFEWTLAQSQQRKANQFLNISYHFKNANLYWKSYVCNWMVNQTNNIFCYSHEGAFNGINNRPCVHLLSPMSSHVISYHQRKNYPLLSNPPLTNSYSFSAMSMYPCWSLTLWWQYWPEM